MGLHDSPYALDQYVVAGRHRVVNYDDGTANATTNLYLGTVPDGANIDFRVDTKTSFNGSTPTGAVVAYSSAGAILATIMDSTACAVTTAQDGKLGYWLATEDADLFFRLARPASGNTQGSLIAQHRYTFDAGSDSVLGGDTLT